MNDREGMVTLTEAELKEMIEKAAESGAEKAIDSFQNRFVMWAGRSVLDKIVYLLGAAAIGLFLFLNKNGWIS